MKKADEYLNDNRELLEDIMDGKLSFAIALNYLETVIKKAQEDAIRTTVKECAENADADYTINGNRFIDDSIEVFVINSSILSVADKLIEQL